MARSIIHDAAFNLDVAALRRGLDAGEAPDLLGFLCRNQNPPSVDALDDFHTGGFKAYEKAHRQRLTATFLPKFPSLPAEIVSHIVSFGFNCGCY